MKTNTRRFWWTLLLVSAILATTAQGQETVPRPAPVTCPPDQSPDTCLLELFEGAPATAGRQAEVQVQKQLAADAEQDLLTNLLTLGGAGSTTDFLQAFIVGLGIPGLDEKEGRLSFTYNTPPASMIQASFNVVENKPELFAKLAEAIPEDQRAVRVAELGKNLGRFDDIEGNVKLAFLGHRRQLSRNLADFDEVFGSRVLNHYDSIRSKEQDEALERMLTLELAGTPFEQMTPDQRARAQSVVTDALNAVRKADQDLANFVQSSGYYKAAELAANQPQLYLSATFQDLDELAGPGHFSATLVWELGLGANINTMLDRCGAKPQAEFVSCYTDYITSAKVKKEIDSKNRIRFEAGYGETEAYDPSVDGVVFQLEKVEKVLGKLGFSRILRFEIKDGKKIEQNSIAFDASYEDVTGDEERQNRLVATLTFNQRLTDDTSFEISAVWANKPEYRGDVDEELSALAGLRYKVNRKN